MSADPLIPSYLDLRARTQRANRGFEEKVTTLEDAVRRGVRDGDHVALGGCTLSRTPMASVFELIRQGRRDLTVSRNIMSTEGDFLLASGAARRIITSWISQGIVWGISKIMRHYVEGGKVVYDEWSHMSIGLGYRAGAMGVPFLPSRTMLGSDLIRRASAVKELDCPYTGERLALIPALTPDVALLHVHRADPYGNAQFDGLPFMDADIAMAAHRVILTTERIITNDQIRRSPDRTTIPFFCVEAVVEVPYGSLPHECYGLYEPYYEHLDEYARLSKERGVEGAREYLDRYVHGPKGWVEYLELLGLKGILDAAARGRIVHDD
ncbi:MAG: CoA transferase subunit A [Candidatus Rokubacteria bacterium]|nr:CoA transferase subunit A [Candidatus Rokubacteria bacterium]